MIFGFLLSIAFDPYIYTGATDPRWALLAVSLPILIAFSSPNNFTLAHLFGVLFLAWASLTLIWTANLWDGLGQTTQLLILGLAIVYGSRLTSLEPFVKGAALGITVSSALLLIPILRFDSLVSNYPHGLFGNRNMFSEFAILIALALIAYRKWLFLPGLAPAIFYYKPEIIGGSLVRSAILALCVGVVAFVWQWSRKAALACIALITAIAFASLIHGWKLGSIIERLEVWNAVWSGTNWWGHGIGSLFTLSPYLSATWDTTLQRVDHAHNEFLEIAFELGGIGAGLYAGIIAYALCLADRKMFPVLLGFLVISEVAFPWHIPANAFMGALVIGHSVRDGKPVRELYHGISSSLRAWYGWCGYGFKPEIGGEAQSI